DAGTVSVKVTATDSGSLSAEDTFDVTVSAPPPVTPVASFGSATSSAGEDGGTQNVTVNLSPAPQSGITVAYTVGGTATAGTDYSIANSGSVQVAANTASVTIPVTITEDTEDEEAETVILTLGSGTGYTVGSENVHTLTINDNDDPPPDTPVVSIGGSPSSMTEGATATFTLTASPAPTGNVAVAVTVAGGSFATGGARTVTVGTSGRASFTVPTTDDETDEPNGTITATVNAGTGYSPHNTEGSASITVNDNDDPPPATPVASFGSAASSAGEDGGTQNVRVNLSPSPQSAITLSYTVGGTATAGTDFSIANSGSVQVAANTASVTIPVTITEDTEDEEAETVVLTLGSGTGYSVGSGNVHTLTINDNDDPPPTTPVVSITGSPSSMTEGDTATFTLTASPAPEDGGDAETGFGLEMGAGLLWADPARGVRGELQGRSLLSHVEEEFREQGLALSFAWDPTPGNRGPSLSLSHAVGATAAGGMDALLQPVVLEELDAPSNGQQFAAELAYGVSAFADRLTLSPGVGLVLSPDGAVYSLGWALAPYAQQAQAEPWELALQGEREQRSATSSAEHSLTLRFSLLF
ncbi:MAG: hypothetical protein F4X84_00180, partial [Synechococcus sp. SB0662_bin_45]|nr:hypothetical protein [Synechococcus sp. SB0662_bin_45]